MLDVGKSDIRSTANALVKVWMKLKTALSYREMAVLFKLSTYSTGLILVTRAFNTIAKLDKNFVPFLLWREMFEFRG